MIKIEQGKDSFAKYAKTFKDIVTSLKAKGTAEEILDSIIDSKFILGVNQETFKDQLAIIFSYDKWPKMQEAIDMFSRFTSTKESVATLNNDNENGKIVANVSKATKFKKEKIRNEARNEEKAETNKNKKLPKDYICVACEITGEHFVQDCKFFWRKCYKCQQPGHKGKFCPMRKKYDSDNEETNGNEKLKKQMNAVMLTNSQMKDYDSYDDEDICY